MTPSGAFATAAIAFLRQAAAAAENDLTYHEPPGWYLPSRGALAAQGKTAPAAAVKKRCLRAWRTADVKL